MIGNIENLDFCLIVVFVVSLFFYVSILFVIAKNLKSDIITGTFFKFAFHLGVIDVIAMLNVYLVVKFRQMGFFFNFYAIFDPFLAHIGVYLTWLLMYLQIAFTTIITTNRFTCIVFPLQSSKVRNISSFAIYCCL